MTLAVFGQGTLSRSGDIAGNDRLGAGIVARLGERVTVEAEASGGDGGARAALRFGYADGPDHEAYVGYTLDPTRSTGRTARGRDDDGTIVAGGRTRLSPSVTSWSESVLDRPGDQRSFTRAHGLTWTPGPAWTLSGTMETGTVDDRIFGTFERTALSAGGVWSPREDLSGSLRVEYREEDGDGAARDRETIAVLASYANQVSTEWRLLADVDALISDAAQGSFADGEYVRATLGFAYRPVASERLDLLFGYSHLRDLPGPDQITVASGAGGPEQVSDVLSVNASYDLSQRFTLGGKLGYRRSRIADRGSSDFVDDAAGLAALRVDWHVLRRWDALVEGRVLRGFDVGSTETGVLVGGYRHIGENLKVGLLYEWGSVSDDVTNIDYRGQGVLLNLVGKF